MSKNNGGWKVVNDVPAQFYTGHRSIVCLSCGIVTDHSTGEKDDREYRRCLSCYTEFSRVRAVNSSTNHLSGWK